MNFLSHYYHELPVSDPYFVAGVIMPDILSNYSKRNGEKVRLNPSKLKAGVEAPYRSPAEGVRQHYFVDGFFHDSGFFDEMTSVIEEKVHTLDFQCFRRRLFAFSHVFLELMLDRSLLLEDRTIADNMYGLLEELDAKTVSGFFNLQEQEDHADGIARHIQVFTERRFIYHYADEERLMMILDAINSGFGNPAFTQSDRMQLTHLIHDMDGILRTEKFPKFPADS